MKFLYSFDTGLKKKTLAEFLSNRPRSKVLLIERSQLFLRIHIRIPLIAYFLGCGLLLLLLWYFGQAFFYLLGLPLAFAGLLLILRPVTKRLLDFALDFVVITPDGVYSYNQSGIFKRGNRFLNHHNIRSITFRYENRVQSLFDNGNIYILSE
jgi:hypothetical protein